MLSLQQPETRKGFMVPVNVLVNISIGVCFHSTLSTLKLFLVPGMWVVPDDMGGDHLAAVT